MAKTNALRNGSMWKVMLALATALLAAGGLIITIKNNSDRIEKVEIKTVENEKDIRELKTDIKYIRKGIDDIRSEVEK